MFEYVTVHGKRDFANVIKVIERTLIWEDYPGLSKRSQYNHMSP